MLSFQSALRVASDKDHYTDGSKCDLHREGSNRLIQYDVYRSRYIEVDSTEGSK